MAWSDSPTAILALRNILFDGPTHKFASRKKVLGDIDGTNVVFKTFEYRRVTNFTTATGTTGVFLNSLQLTPAQVTSDDTASGTFQIDPSVTPIPTNRDALTASYYYQWFADEELDQFLQNASSWLGQSTNYLTFPDGLNAAALRFAAQEAYEAAAMKYSVRVSEVYQLEDAPTEQILKSVEAMKDMAASFMEKAETMRDDYWKRQGQYLAPNFGFALGKVRDITPRR
jgi:hypothetical protein